MNRMNLNKRCCITGFPASVFQAFGMYHIHAQSALTEGRVYGLTLLLNLTYIPLSRIVCSLLTVVISGQLIGLVQNAPCHS